MRGVVRWLTVAALALCLGTLATCAARHPMLPLCEGSLYAREANDVAQEAIAASRAGDAGLTSEKVEAARSSLEEAESRYREAAGSDRDDYRPSLDAIRVALDATTGVLNALEDNPAPDLDAIEAALAEARAALLNLGPAGVCLDQIPG